MAPLAVEQSGSIASFFMSSTKHSPRLRVGAVLDLRRTPSYARSVIEDLLRADYIDFVAAVLIDEREVAERNARLAGLLFRAYSRWVEPRYSSTRDPLERVDCEELIAGARRITATCSTAESKTMLAAEAVQAVRVMDLDALIDFGSQPLGGSVLTAARHGVWRFHFGDGERYPGGSSFWREIVDGEALSGIELRRLGAARELDQVLLSAGFSTTSVPSRRVNRTAPIWGGKHFVLQQLWSLHQLGELYQHAAIARSVHARSDHGLARTSGNREMTAWVVREAMRRIASRVRGPHRRAEWRIALRRSKETLLADHGQDSLGSFLWLTNPRGHFWADPCLFEHEGRTWLFAEEHPQDGGIGRIICGELSEEGLLCNVRTALRRDYHLSYPQVFAAAGEVFMIPESSNSGTVDLYRARTFPDDWVLDTTLLNLRAVDTTVFHAAGKWWLVTSPRVFLGHAPIAWLFCSDCLRGPWRLAPTAAAASRATDSRGAGRVFEHGGRLIRPSQDCSESYGSALLFNEILCLSEAKYAERRIARVEGGWKAGLVGIHSYSCAGPWEAIDGYFR
jgi:hypothetical protein